MQRYKVTGPRPVHDTAPGSEFEAGLDAADEASMLAAGRIEIVPREYEVVGPKNVHGAKPGRKFKAALPIHQEAALIEGGHIEVVKSAAKPQNRSRS